MSFAWGDFLDLARRLVADYQGDPIDEAAYRSAISRAYYAAHKAATGYLHLIKKDHRLNNRGSDHGAAIDALRGLGPKERMIARQLQELLADRRAADYRQYRDNKRSKAIMSIQRASSVLSNLALLSEAASQSR